MLLLIKKTTKRSWLRQPLVKLSLLAVLIIAVLGWSLSFNRAAPTQQNTVVHTPTALQCAQKLPVDVLAGQVLMVGLTADQMTSQAPIFKQYHVGGAVLMTSPASPRDGGILAFKSNGASSSDPLLIATDEEGGMVQRFASLGTLPTPADMAASYTPAQAQDLIAAHGQKLKAIGIDMVLGPLADVAPANGESPLGNRVFSSNPQVVSSYDLAYVQGWQAAGLAPVIKHFPGLGAASGNTDFQPATTPPLSSLRARDFIPYENLAASGTAVMVGNQNVPGWFSGPASLSPAVDQYLRATLRYKDNLVITDSLAAKAITANTDVPNAVVQAIAAGNDMVIIVSPTVNTITASGNQQFIADSAAAIQKAVQNGVIKKQQLAQAVVHKLNTQKISACSL